MRDTTLANSHDLMERRHYCDESLADREFVAGHIDSLSCLSPADADSCGTSNLD